MRSFSEYNPIAIAIWFFAVTGVTMFCAHPVFIIISLFGAVTLFIVRNGGGRGREHLFFILLFIVLALINPLVSHNGKTVLFVLAHSPVTLEATLYGMNSAAMIVSVLYFFRSFTQIMTSEKLLYITGAFSPKLSLVLSMAMRAVPLFGSQTKRVNDAQKAMGLYSDDNIIDDIRGKTRVFSILVTWALENGIITADSMAARGYGAGRRTNMKRFGFRRSDLVFTIAAVLLLIVTAAGFAADSLGFEFYPAIHAEIPGTTGIIGIISYSLLVFLPIIIETEVRLRWKYLRSKI